MIHLFLSALWASAFAQFGLAGIVLIGAVAVFLWVPLPGARHVAVAVASVCLIFLFLAPKLYIEGIRHEKAKWDAAEAAAERNGTAARIAAEQQVASEFPLPSTVGGPAPAAVPHRAFLQRILRPRGVQHHDKLDRDDR